MANLRDFSDAIRAQVREFSEKDTNWNWSVKGISKNQIKVHWTYLDYCGEENNCFFVTLSTDEDGDSYIAARLPDEEFITGWCVGEGESKKSWQDPYDKAIKSALNVIFDYALSRY